jgi:acyl carrier protein
VSKDEILAGLTEILFDTFGRSDFEVTRETKASDIAEWDSFNHINIIVASEIRFGIKFRTAELEGLRNVGEFVDVIVAKAGARRP